MPDEDQMIDDEPTIDADTKRYLDDVKAASEKWAEVRAKRAFERCPVIYQYRQKPLLYTLVVDGRILIAWPNLNMDRLRKRLDLSLLEKRGVVLPKMGLAGRTFWHTQSSVVPFWLEDEVDVVPLFSLRGSSGSDSALLVADCIRDDVRSNLGKTKRIGLTPPDENPTNPRVLSAAGLRWRLSSGPTREHER